MTTRKQKTAPTVNNDLQAMIAQAVAQALGTNKTQLVATNEPTVITKAEGENSALDSLLKIVEPVLQAERTFTKLVSNTSAALVLWADKLLKQGLTAIQLNTAIDSAAKYVTENGVKDSTLKVYLSQLRLVISHADTKLDNGKVRDLLVSVTAKGEDKPASLKGAYDKISKVTKKPLTAKQQEAERAEKLASEFRALASRTMRDTGLMTEVKKGIKVESVTFADGAYIKTAEALISSLLDTLATEAEKHALKAQAKRLEHVKAELHDFINE